MSTPKNLGEKLEECDFSNVYQQAGMALDLYKLNRNEKVETDLIIERADNIDSLIQWSEVVSEVFKIRIDFSFLKFLNSQKEISFYLGKIEGQPVSTLMLYLSFGVAGLHAVSTLPQYRSKGYGLSISRKALIDALKSDYHIGVLQASSLGEPVYRKLGFKKYCDIFTYALPEE